jgi:hypothetical protein
LMSVEGNSGPLGIDRKDNGSNRDEADIKMGIASPSVTAFVFPEGRVWTVAGSAYNSDH